MAIWNVCRSPTAHKSCEELYNGMWKYWMHLCSIIFTLTQRTWKRNVCYLLCRHVTQGCTPTRSMLSTYQEAAAWKADDYLPFRVQRKNMLWPLFGNSRCRGKRTNRCAPTVSVRADGFVLLKDWPSSLSSQSYFLKYPTFGCRWDTGLPEEALVLPAQCLLHRTERNIRECCPLLMVHSISLQSAAFFGQVVPRYPCPQVPEMTLIYGCDLSLQPQPSNQPLSGWRSHHNVAHKRLSHHSHFSSRLPTMVCPSCIQSQQGEKVSEGMQALCLPAVMGNWQHLASQSCCKFSIKEMKVMEALHTSQVGKDALLQACCYWSNRFNAVQHCFPFCTIRDYTQDMSASLVICRDRLQQEENISVFIQVNGSAFSTLSGVFYLPWIDDGLLASLHVLMRTKTEWKHAHHCMQPPAPAGTVQYQPIYQTQA